MRTLRPNSRPRLFLAILLPVLASTCHTTQTASPGSITRSPCATCGGSSKTVGDGGGTLPERATCDTVDVFLLFDDTGTFEKNVAKTGEEFQKIVDRLQSKFPNVSFALGVGRFEEYGGEGSRFAGSHLPLERPFILNQALLETGHPSFTDLLEAALGDPKTPGDERQAPGHGVDNPETAIEALFQVATGVGFDGDGNGSVADSGPAGALVTQVSPGPSGDVPSFSSYQGVRSGALGGVGWRASSCERLVLLATDACAVAPFQPSAAFLLPSAVSPEEIVGTGGRVPLNAFHCSPTYRSGPVGDAKAPTRTAPSAVAPLGAATVQATVQALDDLGIRVVGLGALRDRRPGAHDPFRFLPAMARLTGAVRADGTPLVFDLGSASGAEIQNAVVAAVEQSLVRPSM